MNLWTGIGLGMLVICTACAPVENRPPIDLVAARGMVPGVTTRAQAVKSLGEPYANSKQDGKISLIWGWTRAKPLENSWVSTSVVAVFDANGVLVSAPTITETEKPAGSR